MQYQPDGRDPQAVQYPRVGSGGVSCVPCASLQGLAAARCAAWLEGFEASQYFSGRGSLRQGKGPARFSA